MTMWEGTIRSRDKRIEIPSYAAVHLRLKQHHGDPSVWLCLDCDEQAQEWSLDPFTPEHEIITARYRYSTNERWYSPRCRSHHRKLDAALRRDRANR